MRSTRTQRPGFRAGRRGMTILEGLMASLVLLLGMLGIIRGVIVAGQQNSVANQMTRAGAITNQVRIALESEGRERLVGGATPLFAPANCIAPNDPNAVFAGGLEDAGLATPMAGAIRLCILDFDAAETARGPNPLVPGYPAADRAAYRRFLVLFQTLDTVPDPVTLQPITYRANQVAIVVSWMAFGQRMFSREFVGFYDSSALAGGNSTRIDI